VIPFLIVSVFEGMKKRIETLDYVRGVAILLVVFMHSIEEYVQIFDYHSISTFTGLLLHQVCLPALPLFLFITGLFIAKTTVGDKSTSLWNRISKIYIPYLIWAPVFFILIGSSGIYDPRGVVLKTLLFKHVYWYFALYLICILGSPLLGWIPANRLRKALWVSLVISLFSGLVGTALFYTDFQEYRGIIDYVFLRSPFYWGFFFVAGYVTSRMGALDHLLEFLDQRSASIFISAAVLALLATTEWYVLTEVMKVQLRESIFQLRLLPQVYSLFGGAAIMLVVRKADGMVNAGITKRFLGALGRRSLQVYLLHPIFVYVVGPRLISQELPPNAIKALCFVMGVGLPLAIAYAAKRISSRFSSVVMGY
jgi:surface polysaccharide O-acyltransferase-like enzyme